MTAVYREMGDLDAAEAWYARAEDIARKNAPEVRAQYDMRILRADIALARGRLEDARAELDIAVTAGGMPATKVYAFMPRAELNMREGKLAAAEADARQALSIARAAQGGIPYSNRTGLASLMLGRVLAAKGEHDRAHEAFQLAIAHLSRTVSEQHPMLKLARELASR
jgi:tetratricopeptide (TPR) repeat protein